MQWAAPKQGRGPHRRMVITADIVFESAMNEALFAYWRARAGAKSIPARGDIDPVVDLGHLVQHLFLVDVERDPLRFRYRLVGTKVVEHVGTDMTGKYLDQLVEFDTQYARVKPDYETTVERRTATVSLVRFLTKDGEHSVNYERLLLPLSDDGRTVNMILGGCCPLDD